MTEFNNRVFGCAVVKAINSNYNADFSGQPRTLPSGTVYATDKAFKYTVKNYLKDVYSNDYVLYFKRLKSEFTPDDLSGAYERKFATKVKDDPLEVISKNLLSCIDVRLFGSTFAPKGDGIKNKNVSLHDFELDIQHIIESDDCPPLAKKSICRNCSYYDFCYADEEDSI